MASYKPVTASLRVLEVLQSVNVLGDGATVGNLVRETGLDKATTIRMLQTLIHAEYVFHDQDRIYRPTGKSMQLSSGYDRHRVITNCLSEPVERLFKTMDWPSDLAVRDGIEMLIVKSSRFGGALSFNRRPYHRAPILETSVGLAYLAHCGAEEREEIIERLASKSQTGCFADLKNGAFASLIRQIREQGFAAMDSGYREREFENRVDAIGVPILVGEAAVASINVMYLRNTVEAGTVQSVLLPKLQAAAAEMGVELSKDKALFGLRHAVE